MNAPTLSPVRKLCYAAIACVAALVLLGALLESALRLGGYGYSPHFARKTTAADGTVWWRENRWCTAPFFTPELVRRPQPFRLATPKPARTYRVFVLGSSAAMGDPEASFSLARMLETMLRAAYPEQRFEVVNAGITAINSHLVRGIAADCAQLEPDAFVVYEGNNEVIGPFGPAGVFAPFLRNESLVHLAVAAKASRSGQFLGAAARAVTSRRSPADWGGMQMFLAQRFAESDPRLNAVADQFRSNLEAIVRSGRDAGAPVFLCTVVTNARDFAPFMSLHRPGLSDTDRARWDAAFAAAVTTERRGDLGAAEQEFRRALEVDDAYAELAFRLGRLELQRGHDDEARRLLQRAVDLDALRFRTDSRLNETIREVARTADGATLVDLAAELSAQASHGIAGDDLLYEHVHLNFRGTYESAARLFAVVSADLVRRGQIEKPATAPIGIEAVRQRLAFTTYDQAMIGVELLRRFHAAPFTGQADDSIRIAAWDQRVAAANALLARPGATDSLRQIYDQALAAAPDDWVLARNAGEMLVARGRPADAVPLLERARQIIPDDADTLVALALAHRALGETREADALFAEVRRIEPRHPLLPR